jgi:hypothetical protein
MFQLVVQPVHGVHIPAPRLGRHRSQEIRHDRRCQGVQVGQIDEKNWI